MMSPTVKPGTLRASVARATARFVAMDAFVAQKLAATPSSTKPALAVTNPVAKKRGDLRAGYDLTIGKGLEAALRQGWHVPEAWGAWTSARDATLALNLGQRPIRPLIVEVVIAASAHAPSDHSCRIVVGTETAASLEFLASPISHALRARIEPQWVSTDGALDLHLVVGAIFQPSAQGDRREFGVALERVRLVGEAEDPKEPAFLTPGAVMTPDHGLGNAITVGWYPPDGDRIWTASKRAILRLEVGSTLLLPQRLRFRLFGLSPADRPQTVTIAFGARIVARHVFQGAAPEWVSTWLMQPDLSAKGLVDVTIMVDAHYTPLELGRGGDGRRLGVALLSIHCDEVSHIDRRQVRPRMPVGAVLTSGSGLEHSLIAGWNHLEAWGAWTAATEALVALRLVADGSQPVRLRLHLSGALPTSGTQTVTLVAAGQSLVVATFTASQPDRLIELVVPAEAISPEGDVNLILRVDQSFSPAQQGGDDVRTLGAGLRSITYIG